MPAPAAPFHSPLAWRSRATLGQRRWWRWETDAYKEQVFDRGCQLSHATLDDIYDG